MTMMRPYFDQNDRLHIRAGTFYGAIVRLGIVRLKLRRELQRLFDMLYGRYLTIF